MKYANHSDRPAFRCLVAGIVWLSCAILACADDQDIPWLRHIQDCVPEHAGLVDKIVPLLNATPAVSAAPLAVITFRAGLTGIKDQVIQLYPQPAENHSPLINPQGTVRDRSSPAIAAASDQFLNLMLQPPESFGDPAEVRRQQRALNLTFTGDLTLLREQTVEPLHVVAVLTRPDQYMPASLRSRVKAVVLTAQLDFGEWRGHLNFVTANPTDAEQVGNIVAAWRDLASALAERYAGHASGARLREALLGTTVTIADNRVNATTTLPAPILVRVAKEAAGHGGGCPPGGVCDRNQIAICHQAGNQLTTICVPPATVATHLAHGDTCGVCATSTAP